MSDRRAPFACVFQADIRVWMLTGDKKETAINIGYSCSLLHDDMNVLVLGGRTLGTAVAEELAVKV